jgi:probable phosphoglycerate mutase
MMTEQRWDVIPGAESSETFTARTVGAIERIAARHVDEFVVVFTHGAVIAQLLAHATGARRFSFLSDNASISHLVVHEGRWLVRRYNDTTHLHAAFTTAPEPMT